MGRTEGGGSGCGERRSGYIEIRPSRTMRRNEYDEQTVVRRLKEVTREDIERKRERERRRKENAGEARRQGQDRTRSDKKRLQAPRERHQPWFKVGISGLRVFIFWMHQAS